MFSFLQSIKQRDPAAKNYLEIMLCYPGVHALFFHRICHLLHKLNVPVLPRFIANISRILTGVEIHPGATIGKNLFIDHGIGVIIGETSIIGNNVTIYQGVTLGSRTSKQTKRHPTIGDNVVIGAGAKIIGNIKVGDGSKIGAGAVVVENVDDGKVIIADVGKEMKRKVIESYTDWSI